MPTLLTVHVEECHRAYASNFNGILSGVLNLRVHDDEMVNVIFILHFILTASKELLHGFKMQKMN